MEIRTVGPDRSEPGGEALTKRLSHRQAAWSRVAVLWIVRLLLLAVFLLAWQLAYNYGLVNRVFLGSPLGAARFLVNDSADTGAVVHDLGITFVATLVAFAIGSVVGLAVGLLFVVVRVLEELVAPALAALNALPRIALAPLFILWLGIGTAPTILLGASLTFFAVLHATQAGARSVDPDILTLCETLGATKTQRFTRVIIPGSVPILFSGLQLGLVYALLGVVAGEIVGAPSGLGQRLTFLAGSFQSNGVYGILILLMALGGVMSAIMTRLERRLSRWR